MGGKGDVPDSSSGTNIHHSDHVLKVGISISADTNGLISVDAGDVGELLVELVVSDQFTVHISGAVFADVDDDF